MTPENLIEEFWPDLEQVRIEPLTNVAGTEITAWQVTVLLSGSLIEAFSDASYGETLKQAEIWLRTRRDSDARLDREIMATLRGNLI